MTHDDRVKLAVQLAAGMLAGPYHDQDETLLAGWAWQQLEAIEAEGEKRRKAVKEADAWDRLEASETEK